MSEPKWIDVPGKKVRDGGKKDKFASAHKDGDFVFPKKGVQGVWTWAPEGELLGTVIFVHGMYDNAETSWKGDFAHYKSSMHEPGVPLRDQFEESGLKALFVVPEAEIARNYGEEVVWRDLDELLKTVGAPEGPVAAMSHSQGHFTVAYWLDHPRLVHVSSIDSMYSSTTRPHYEKWFKGDSKRYLDLLVNDPPVPKNGKKILDEFPDDYVKAPTPPVLDAQALSKRILFMWPKPQKNGHMKFISEGVLIPAFCKRIENTFLKHKGEKGVEPETSAPKPEPVVFEAGGEHSIESPLQSELKQVPLLNTIAITP